jgi:hypothetical protein
LVFLELLRILRVEILDFKLWLRYDVVNIRTGRWHNMKKKFEIYKKDKWNMMHVEVQGSKIIVTEISDQWGEESFTFIGRAALMHWVEQRFPKPSIAEELAQWQTIMDQFKEI